MTEGISAADQIRAQETALARRKAEHDAPLLARASEILAAIKPLADELGAIGQQVLAPYVGSNLTAVMADVDRAAPMIVLAATEAASAAAKPLTEVAPMAANLKVED